MAGLNISPPEKSVRRIISMSIDRSLKTKGALRRHRNVLSRGERIEQLQLENRWSEDDSVTGLPKVAHRKSHSGKKSSAADEKVQEALVVEGETETKAEE